MYKREAVLSMLNLRRTLQLMSYSYRRPCEVSLVWTGPVSLMLYHFRCDASQSKAEIVVIHHKAHHQQVCSAPRTLAVNVPLHAFAAERRAAAPPRVIIRPGFPGHVLFFGLCPGVRAGFRKSAVCPGFRPNPQVLSNVANCKGVRRHETKKAR